jgi:hypothetical protein
MENGEWKMKNETPVTFLCSLLHSAFCIVYSPFFPPRCEGVFSNGEWRMENETPVTFLCSLLHSALSILHSSRPVVKHPPNILSRAVCQCGRPLFHFSALDCRPFVLHVRLTTNMVI